jgi:hypothetical protein
MKCYGLEKTLTIIGIWSMLTVVICAFKVIGFYFRVGTAFTVMID